jgi:hypothetical protein
MVNIVCGHRQIDLSGKEKDHLRNFAEISASLLANIRSMSEPAQDTIQRMNRTGFTGGHLV